MPVEKDVGVVRKRLDIRLDRTVVLCRLLGPDGLLQVTSEDICDGVSVIVFGTQPFSFHSHTLRQRVNRYYRVFIHSLAEHGKELVVAVKFQAGAWEQDSGVPVFLLITEEEVVFFDRINRQIK